MCAVPLLEVLLPLTQTSYAFLSLLVWIYCSLTTRLCYCGRHLGNAGEAAVHLLGRLLAFDPARRCSAEEALAHEYLHSFEAIDMQLGKLCIPPDHPPPPPLPTLSYQGQQPTW